MAIAGLLGMAVPAAAANAAGSKPADAEQGTTKAKPTLAKGMTADEVLKAVGKPAEVKPMKTETGKAEEWIYRRELGKRVVRVASGEREVPVFDGMGLGSGAMKTRHEIIYTSKHVTVYQVTTLLMFDGKLILANQKVEQDDRFE
ncbi:MAG TPA: hypothetical protein VHE13_13490 [Opitutus sp.]|nr:hypothetical protein [Opitutus sp.]